MKSRQLKKNKKKGGHPSQGWKNERYKRLKRLKKI